MRETSLRLLEPVPVAGPTDPALWPGEVVDGRYHLRAALGTGATSTVWLGYDDRLRRPVALKELARGRQRFTGAGELEAQTAARVASRNVVKVYDFVADDRSDTDWIVMEALSGSDLASVLRREGSIDVDEARYVGAQVLAALCAVHEAGLVHRDVKPANVHLCRDGRVVLTDFGLATAPCVAGGVDSGGLVGSLSYIAPEVLREGRYSRASDFYALGMTLFAAVTGRAPVTAPDDVLARRAQPLRVDGLPGRASDLHELLRGLLDPDPASRFGARASELHLT